MKWTPITISSRATAGRWRANGWWRPPPPGSWCWWDPKNSRRVSAPDGRSGGSDPVRRAPGAEGARKSGRRSPRPDGPRRAALPDGQREPDRERLVRGDRRPGGAAPTDPGNPRSAGHRPLRGHGRPGAGGRAGRFPEGRPAAGRSRPPGPRLERGHRMGPGTSPGISPGMGPGAGPRAEAGSRSRSGRSSRVSAKNGFSTGFRSKCRGANWWCWSGGAAAGRPRCCVS